MKDIKRPIWYSLVLLEYFNLDYALLVKQCLFIFQTLPIESTMRNPKHFLGCFGVLNISTSLMVILYCSMGFFGYLRYGEDTAATITLNISSSL